MATVAARPFAGNTRFQDVVEPFLQQPGLPFAEVLSAQDVEQVFKQRDALFAIDDTFSTPVVLWAFLAQVLRDGKGAACAAAVADIATYMNQLGLPAPSGDTGDYCRARAKLNVEALRTLVRQTARRMEEQAGDDWLWQARHAKLVDGFTFTMPDTPDNQAVYPQLSTQEPGVGLPIARACVVLSLATAGVHDLATGPYEGKETGETALLRTMLDSFQPGDVAVFDRYYCSYMMLALLKNRGVDVCTRLHQCRKDEWPGDPCGDEDDFLVTWQRPACPPWMSSELYADIPETMTLRVIRLDVKIPGQPTETLVVVTTLIDAEAYPKEAIAELYGYRWYAELDIRDIKQTLGLDHARCKTPEMVKRELWVTLLAYNLIRKVIAMAAVTHDKKPRELGFTLGCQTILSSWMLLSTGACRDTASLTRSILDRIAANEVGKRPGRIEPRVLKRRRHRYPLMTRPRQQLREEADKT